MGFEIRRKLYKRGSSFETTIPMPLLFAIDKEKKHNVVFAFDSTANRWFVKFEENKDENKGKKEKKKTIEKIIE